MGCFRLEVTWVVFEVRSTSAGLFARIAILILTGVTNHFYAVLEVFGLGVLGDLLFGLLVRTPGGFRLERSPGVASV